MTKESAKKGADLLSDINYFKNEIDNINRRLQGGLPQAAVITITVNNGSETPYLIKMHDSIEEEAILQYLLEYLGYRLRDLETDLKALI